MEKKAKTLFFWAVLKTLFFWAVLKTLFFWAVLKTLFFWAVLKTLQKTTKTPSSVARQSGEVRWKKSRK
jgi:nucleoside permease NupC